MQDDCIKVELGLPQLKVLEEKELETHFEVKVIYRRSEATCPRCGRITSKVHDCREQWKQDRRLRDKPVYLNLIKRRFRCLWCGKVWTEPDEVFGCRRRSSHRFREHLGQEALHQTIKRTAEKEQVGEGLVRRCVTEGISQMLSAGKVVGTPELIGLDEYSAKKGLYHTAVCDLGRREVMEVVEGRGCQKVQAYLESFPDPDRVKAVAMDMHEPYREAVQMCLPRAKVVVDHFHVIRHVNRVVDAIRIRLQTSNGQQKKTSQLYKRRYSLLKGREHLANWERPRLVQLFGQYPELKKAWQMKEEFRDWYRSSNRREAETRLKSIEQGAAVSNLVEFDSLRSILTDWRDEILNYFDCQITNGFVEGKNNRIKTLKRMGYGYRNMANFRLRILAANRPARSVSHLLT